jgi:hypothetical protein
LETILGLLGLALFIPAVVAIAASITWLVVRISPAPDKTTSKQA